MIVNTECSITHSTIADVLAKYPIPFQYIYVANVPQISVVLDGNALTYMTDYTLDTAGLQLTVEPEAGLSLIIERTTPLTQTTDFQTGIIDPDEIEDSFDLAVLRDQELRHSINVFEETQDEVITRVENIEAVIPEGTDEANQLTNKSYVDTQDTVITEMANDAVETAHGTLAAAENAVITANDAVSIASGADNKSDQAVIYAQEAVDMAASMRASRHIFTIEAGQTTLVFDDNIENKQIDLYWNGVLITQDGNWTVSDDTITMLFGVEEGDTVVAYLNSVRQVVNVGDLISHIANPNAHPNLDMDCGTMS